MWMRVQKQKSNSFSRATASYAITGSELHAFPHALARTATPNRELRDLTRSRPNVAKKATGTTDAFPTYLRADVVFTPSSFIFHSLFHLLGLRNEVPRTVLQDNIQTWYAAKPLLGRWPGRSLGSRALGHPWVTLGIPQVDLYGHGMCSNIFLYARCMRTSQGSGL